jgi:hypothetical protein
MVDRVRNARGRACVHFVRVRTRSQSGQRGVTRLTGLTEPLLPRLAPTVLGVPRLRARPRGLRRRAPAPPRFVPVVARERDLQAEVEKLMNIPEKAIRIAAAVRKGGGEFKRALSVTDFIRTSRRTS